MSAARVHRGFSSPIAVSRELVQTLKTQEQADPGESNRRAQAAKLRAAREREQRIADALKLKFLPSVVTPP